MSQSAKASIYSVEFIIKNLYIRYILSYKHEPQYHCSWFSATLEHQKEMAFWMLFWSRGTETLVIPCKRLRSFWDLKVIFYYNFKFVICQKHIFATVNHIYKTTVNVPLIAQTLYTWLLNRCTCSAEHCRRNKIKTSNLFVHFLLASKKSSLQRKSS